MAGTATKLGPGTLVIGDTVAPSLDMSCQLSGAKVAWDKDKEDDTPTLCGDTVAGATTYTGKLSGTVLIDLSDDGLVDFTWTNKGQQFPFVFIPNTAAGKQITGTVTVDPLDVGGDEVKKNMTSDFEWDCVGMPELEAIAVATTARRPMSTDALAGLT
jgi:hypothetical protein